MTEPLHWLTCKTCGCHVAYVVGRGSARFLKRCPHMPDDYRRKGPMSVARARQLVRTGLVHLTTQERLFS